MAATAFIRSFAATGKVSPEIMRVSMGWALFGVPSAVPREPSALAGAVGSAFQTADQFSSLYLLTNSFTWERTESKDCTSAPRALAPFTAALCLVACVILDPPYG